MSERSKTASAAPTAAPQPTKTFTCIVCPNGCDITAFLGSTGTLEKTEGQLCPRGITYVQQELTDPRRNIATSVRVLGGEAPITSVRLTGVIPKGEIFNAMAQINAESVTAPCAIGDVVIANLLGLGVDVIVTKPIAAQSAAQ